MKQLFQLHGWRVINFWQGPMSEPGIPDLLAISKPGAYPYTIHLWIEMKRPPSRQNPKGRVRKAQAVFLDDVTAREGFAIVSDGVTKELEMVANGAAGLEGLLALVARSSAVATV